MTFTDKLLECLNDYINERIETEDDLYEVIDELYEKYNFTKDDLINRMFFEEGDVKRALGDDEEE